MHNKNRQQVGQVIGYRLVVKCETETGKWRPGKPEDEDEEAEKGEEGGDVVHRSQHDEQLMTQRRQETNQLQYPQQSKRTKYRQTGPRFLEQLSGAARTHTDLGELIYSSLFTVNGRNDYNTTK